MKFDVLGGSGRHPKASGRHLEAARRHLEAARRHLEASGRHVKAPWRWGTWPGGPQAEEPCPGEGNVMVPGGSRSTKSTRIESTNLLACKLTCYKAVSYQAIRL